MAILNYLSVCLIFLSFQAFAGEENCPKGQYRVRSHPRVGYVRSDGTAVRPTHVSASCKMLTKSVEFLKPILKKGLPKGWPHLKEQPGAWSESEMQMLFEAAEELPDVLFSKNLHGLFRLQKSKFFPNPASGIAGVVAFYDTAFDPSRNLSRILAHELSHQIYRDYSNDIKRDYRRAADWDVKAEADGSLYWIGRKSGYVEEDGRSSRDEDFANNIEYFLYEPDKLKKETPKVEVWIRKQFGEDFKLKKRPIK